MTLTYSNPRMRAAIENWPSGRQRVTAIFEIEETSRGQRGTRVTTGAKKTLTYAKKARIADGNDGKTYILNMTEFGHISVMQSNMQFNKEAIFPDNPRYADITQLFD